MKTTRLPFTQMKTQDVYDFVSAQAQKVADEWFKAQSLDNYAALYVYYRPAELCAASDPPGPDWTLAHGDRIRPGSTRAQVQRWVNDMAQRIPFLIEPKA
jgi:hypothetical protein